MYSSHAHTCNHIHIHTHRKWGGKLKYIEQRELYSSKSDGDTCKKNNDAQKHVSILSKYRAEDGAKPIFDSLKSTRMPESILEPVLHGRSVAMNDFSELVKQMNSTDTTSKQQLAHHQAFSTTSSKQSSHTIAMPSHSFSSTKSGTDALPLSRVSSPHSQISISDQSTSTDSTSECTPKALLATEPIAQSQFSPQLPEESCHSVLTLPNPMEQSGRVQSPLMNSSGSPTSSVVMISPQQDFISSPEQFLDFTTCPVEMCPPYISATGTDCSPPNAYPADVDMMLQTVTGTDSIPFATSVLIPYSQTPNFIPQAPATTDFNPQILPSDLNFLSNTNVQNFDTAPCLDAQSLQVFDCSNPLLNDTVASDSLMQQIVDEMTDESNFNPMASASNYSMNANSAASSSHLQANPHVLDPSSFINAGSCQPTSVLNTADQSDTSAYFLCDSQTNDPNSSSSNNMDVQDILQQFM